MAKNKDKKKIPFNTFRKGLTAGLLGLTMMAGSAGLFGGCTGEPGAKGDTGATGKSAYELAVEQGFQGTLTEWLESLKGQSGGSGSAGNGIVSIEKTGTNGLIDTYTITFTDGTTTTFDITNGEDGETIEGDDGKGIESIEKTGTNGLVDTYTITFTDGTYTTFDVTNGNVGATGNDGISAYVGYDGYIWNGTERTEFSVNANLEENVVENTIGIQGTMSKYFEGEYLDLSSNTVALMSNYMPNANMTLYSDSNVTEITLYSENVGTLLIGTAKVRDVVSARTTGITYASSTKSYNLNVGLNKISLNLNVAEDETIILGGNGSTAKLYIATGIANNDEAGNFTLVNGQTNSDVISNNGTYADTLAVQVKATFVSGQIELTPSALDFVKTTELENTKSLDLTTNYGLIYINKFFENSQITKVGFPIKTVKTIGAESEASPHFTISVVKYGTTPVEVVKSYNVTIPYETLKDVAVYSSANSNYTIDRYVYVDVSDLNIVLGENETLSFFSANDTVTFGYLSTTETTSTHNFAYTTMANPVWDKAPTKNHVSFDVYGKKFNITLEEHLAELENSNADSILANALQGKNISILGDSISTYINWSNNTSYNSTLEENGTTAYNGIRHGVPNVNETWWKQTIDQTGMNLLVDNAKSGAKVSESLDRARQLHSDVGDDNGTNPDIIAIWIGINDVRYGTSATDFAGYYRTMIESITTQYNASDVYVFTLIPQKDHQYATDETIQQVNAKIREIANEFGCTIVDLYNDSGINLTNSGTYMYDYLHPNTKGMDIVTNCFKEKLFENYITNA